MRRARRSRCIRASSSAAGAAGRSTCWSPFVPRSSVPMGSSRRRPTTTRHMQPCGRRSRLSPRAPRRRRVTCGTWNTFFGPRLSNRVPSRVPSARPHDGPLVRRVSGPGRALSRGGSPGTLRNLLGLGADPRARRGSAFGARGVRLAATAALGRLRRLGKPVFTTGDAALHLGLTLSATTRSLGRLAEAGLVLKVRNGLWSLDLQLDPLRLPEHLTAPFPAYVSLQTALQLHGLISQVPRVVYAVSLSPTRRVRTHIADFSIHRLTATFFGGFVTTPGGVRLATPEKALVDTLYLGPARSRLFATLPEVEIPRRFDREAAWHWVDRIAPWPRRVMVQRRLERLLGPRATAAERARGGSRPAREPRRSGAGSPRRTGGRRAGGRRAGRRRDHREARAPGDPRGSRAR